MARWIPFKSSPSDLKRFPLREIRYGGFAQVFLWGKFWGQLQWEIKWTSQGGVLGKICEIRVDDLEMYMSDVYRLICSLWLDDPTRGASALEPTSCVLKLGFTLRFSDNEPLTCVSQQTKVYKNKEKAYMFKHGSICIIDYMSVCNLCMCIYIVYKMHYVGYVTMYLHIHELSCLSKTVHMRRDWLGAWPSKYKGTW